MIYSRKDILDPIVTVCGMFLETCARYQFDLGRNKIEIPEYSKNLYKNLKNLIETYGEDIQNE